MEEKINIQQNGKETIITASNDIKEVYMTFLTYKVETLKIVFKDEKDI